MTKYKITELLEKIANSFNPYAKPHFRSSSSEAMAKELYK